MERKELLKNEQIERMLSPHPLSFMKLQALCIFIIVWGVVVWWLTQFSTYSSTFDGNAWYPLILWGLVLLLIGVVASLLAIQWSIFFLYLGVFAGGTGLLFWQHWENESALFLMVYSIAVSIVGFLIVELYRRSHRYIISNLRIIFKGGLLTKRERTIRYDKIADIDAKQGILGQIFGFGTIIPVSQSGFGLGSDKTMAAGGLAVGTKKTRFFGFAGGGKEVQTPIARSYYELHGVYPYKNIKQLVEDLVQSNVPTQYQKEQVEFQKQQVDIQTQMRDLLHKQVRERPRKKAVKQFIEEEDAEEEEPEEHEEEVVTKKTEVKQDAFPPEQVDIQQQMKELLKKQKTVRVIEPEEEDVEVEEEKNQDEKSELP
ncbi:MAG: PH domain-containing protein [Candidatus Thermoplasmatota archaeon]|nr:PH domain-containing protein [Candidatus Thermoplasmatota archaeon]